MTLKIRGGTMPHGDETLCATCTHSSIIRGRTLDEEIINCNRTIHATLRIPFKVTTCSDYTDGRLPSMYQLMENAWILRKGSKRRAAGFIHGRDMKVEELSEAISECEDLDGSGSP